MKIKYLVLAIVWGFPFWIKAQFTEDFICIDSANLVIMYKLEYKSDSTMAKGHYEEKMILMIGDSLSCFMSNSRYISDNMVKSGEFDMRGCFSIQAFRLN